MQSIRRAIAAIGVALTLGAAALGQSGVKEGGKLPEFEVVSLKPTNPNGRYLVGVQLTQDRLTMNATTLKELIMAAYAKPYWEVTGGDSWVSGGQSDLKNHYDFVATLPQNGTPYDMRHGIYDIASEPIRGMMQAMLAERFHLKFHTETKTGTVSILEQSGKPLLLVASQMKAAKMYGESYSGDIGAVSGRGWGLYNTSMPQLTAFLSNNILHRPVIDRTGLSGSYDFRSATIITDEDFKQGNVTSMLLPAVKEMGLKLTETQGPAETFVIDHAELPEAN